MIYKNILVNEDVPFNRIVAYEVDADCNECKFTKASIYETLVIDEFENIKKLQEFKICNNCGNRV